VIGRVYKKLNEEMKLLWNKDLKLNTVHIHDVVRACWHLAIWYDENDLATKKQTYPVFNLADKQDTGRLLSNEIILMSQLPHQSFFGPCFFQTKKLSIII
jgi:hypothetical protein